jgi:hypothetical protein
MSGEGFWFEFAGKHENRKKEREEMEEEKRKGNPSSLVSKV